MFMSTETRTALLNLREDWDEVATIFLDVCTVSDDHLNIPRAALQFETSVKFFSDVCL